MSGMLLLAPLDDRPVNLDAPLMLAEVAGETLCAPPSALLGRFLTPGDPDAILAWLAQHAATARAAIVSLDMLVYGGLVASRTPAVPLEVAVRRLNTLREIKIRHPHLRLFAFNVIMRLTITGADPRTRQAGRDIFRYSVLRDQVERLGETALADELAAVEARIPADLLQAYLAARARNHVVNRAAVQLLADGTLDFLALVQEDTAPAGLHVAEQADLTALAAQRTDAARWRLYAGTDEAALTLLARYLLQQAGQPFPTITAFHNPVTAQHPALFEDVPLAETVRRHIDAVGGYPADTGTLLAVQTFLPPQPDLFEMPPLPTPTWEAALATYPAGDTAAWMATLPDAPLAMADVAYCNGGDPHLLHALLAAGRFPTLLSYAGWNTAGNTLGTTLAHAALRVYAQHKGVTPLMEAAHRRMLLVRLLDDGLYQSIVRAWAIQRVEESGASPLNLAEMTPAVEAWVAATLQALWRELCARYPLVALACPFQVTLPWGRLFEVRITPAPVHESGL